MSNQGRKERRISFPGQVMGEVTVFQRMAILDLSTTGAQIETRVALLNDSIHDFRLSLDNRSIIVKGRIVYCRIAELRQGIVLYRCGVEFVEPTPHALAALQDFVAVHSAPRPRPVDAEITDDPGT
jgi:hypothetical protein